MRGPVKDGALRNPSFWLPRGRMCLAHGWSPGCGFWSVGQVRGGLAGRHRERPAEQGVGILLGPGFLSQSRGAGPPRWELVLPSPGLALCQLCYYLCI